MKNSLGNKYSGKKKHFVSIGGGTASTLELPLIVIDKYGAENVDLVIAALAGESPDLWRMVEWLESETGKHVYRVAWQPVERSICHNVTAPYWIDAPEWSWRGIWDVFFKTGRMGSTLADPCSRLLKRETLRRFVLDHYAPGNTVMHVGITAHEIDRMIAITRNWQKIGIRVDADLADIELDGTSAERAEGILGWTPFVYAWGGSHNNCNGFCVKAGHGNMARLLYYSRDEFLYHERNEARFQALHNTDATIMRDQWVIGGERHTARLALRDFRQRMETRWASMLPGFDPFDDLEETPACYFCDGA